MIIAIAITELWKMSLFRTKEYGNSWCFRGGKTMIDESESEIQQNIKRNENSSWKSKIIEIFPH